jgi:hypothetical protein
MDAAYVTRGELLLQYFCAIEELESDSKQKGTRKVEFEHRIYRAAKLNACPDGP